MMYLYVIRDMLLQESASIWEQKNENVAIRAYRNSMKDCPNPQDYRLYLVGEYNHDTDTGKFYDRPVEILTHVEVSNE